MKSNNEKTISQIKHVQQPDQNTCAIASVAMVCDKPFKLVLDAYKHYYGPEIKGVYNDQVKHLLTLYGCGTEDYLPYCPLAVGTYIFGVASLNRISGSHMLVVDIIEEVYEPFIFDPQKGNEGKKYYTSFEELKAINTIIKVLKF
ncbi:MAG: hypothetical protein OQL19_10225 [Gammaproteobacteria bacterium]|nr:hypothetical protein [Gammaproteobacteria bacterium]